jgi:hypothetical protein
MLYVIVLGGRLPVLRISYHRAPATPGAASTDWLVTSDSYVPKFR